MCDVVREQPDGEDEEDELDPRVEIELEKLNTASNDINILEKELDEARAIFRQHLTDAARNLKQLAKSLGNNIDKARPYFEALNQSKQAQLECQNAAMTYERAYQLHKGARETISIAEEKLMHNAGMFDAAWQEMLNNANQKILEAEKEKLKNECLHQQAAMAYRELAERASALEKDLKKPINKARPYFEQKSVYLGFLESQKFRVEELQSLYTAAKVQYSSSLRNLELISEDIHRKRKNASAEPPSVAATPSQRGQCVGAEAQVSRRKSTLRRMSEERLKSALRQRSYVSGARFRSSLVLDLDVDFDLEDTFDFGEAHKSPSSNSVDMGCVSLKYYEDFQVLDVAPFLEKDRRESFKTQPSFEAIPEITEISPLKHEHLKVHNAEHHENISLKRRSNTNTSNASALSSEFDEIYFKGRSNSEFDIISSFERNISPFHMLSDAKQAANRCSVIKENEFELSLDTLDNIRPHESDVESFESEEVNVESDVVSNSGHVNEGNPHVSKDVTSESNNVISKSDNATLESNDVIFECNNTTSESNDVTCVDNGVSYGSNNSHNSMNTTHESDTATHDNDNAIHEINNTAHENESANNDINITHKSNSAMHNSENAIHESNSITLEENTTIHRNDNVNHGNENDIHDENFNDDRESSKEICETSMNQICANINKICKNSNPVTESNNEKNM